MKRHLAVLLAYSLLALVATHPLWQHLADGVPGDVGDPVLNTYILAWDTHALAGDPLHLFNANVFYPLPNTLAYSENLLGDALLALPITLLSGQPLLGYNFVFLASFVLAGYGMYLFMLRVTHQHPAAFVAGVAFAFAPYRLASLAHIQLLAVQWLPLVANGLWRRAEGRRGTGDGGQRRADGGRRTADGGRWTADGGRRTILVLCLFLWLQVASSLHGAAFALVLVLTFILVQLVRALLHTPRAPRARLSVFGLLLPVLVLAVAIAPLALPYFAVLDALRAARPPDATQTFAASLGDFGAAASGNLLFGALTLPLRLREGFSEEHTLFMGIVTPLLALAGLWRRDRAAAWFAVLALAAFVLAIDPALTRLIPLASLMRVPARWAALLAFALAALCGLAISGWVADKRMGAPRPLIGLFLLLIVVLVFLEGFSAPLPIAQIGSLQAQTAVYHFLAQQPDRDAVIELPLYVAPDPEFPEGKRMYASALHWHPLVNGYSGFTPARQVALAARLKGFPDDQSLAALRELARAGVRYVLVHSGEPGIPRRDWVQQNRARALDSGALRLLGSFSDNDLFEIVP